MITGDLMAKGAKKSNINFNDIMTESIKGKKGLFQYYWGPNIQNASHQKLRNDMTMEGNEFLAKWQQHASQVSATTTLKKLLETKIQTYHNDEQNLLKTMLEQLNIKKSSSFSQIGPYPQLNINDENSIKDIMAWWGKFQQWLVSFAFSKSENGERNYELDLYKMLAQDKYVSSTKIKYSQITLSSMVSRHNILTALNAPTEEVTEDELDIKTREELDKLLKSRTLGQRIFLDIVSADGSVKKLSLKGDNMRQLRTKIAAALRNGSFKDSLKDVLKEIFTKYNSNICAYMGQAVTDDKSIPLDSIETIIAGARTEIGAEQGNIQEIRMVIPNQGKENIISKIKSVEAFRIEKNLVGIINFIVDVAGAYYDGEIKGTTNSQPISRKEYQEKIRNILNSEDNKAILKDIMYVSTKRESEEQTEGMTVKTRKKKNNKESSQLTFTLLQGILGEFCLLWLGKNKKVKSTGAELQKAEKLSPEVTEANTFFSRETINAGQAFTDAYQLFENAAKAVGFSIKRYTNTGNITLGNEASLPLFGAYAQRYLTIDEIIMISYLLANQNFLVNVLGLNAAGINLDSINHSILNANLKAMRIEGLTTGMETLKDLKIKNDIFYINGLLVPASVVTYCIYRSLEKNQDSIIKVQIKDSNAQVLPTPDEAWVKQNKGLQSLYIRAMNKFILTIGDTHLNIKDFLNYNYRF